MKLMWCDYDVRFSFVFVAGIFASEASAKVHMQSYVTASAPLIQYIDKLFVSRDLGIDWWILDVFEIVQYNLLLIIWHNYFIYDY